MTKYSRILVTGGAGFIGSHIVDHFLADPEIERVVVLDKMTYAADYSHIRQHSEDPRLQLVVGDLIDFEACRKALFDVELVVHAAAESHVDNSFESSLIFTKSNVLGTHTLLQAAHSLGVQKFIHISTDEVYGEALDKAVTEDGRFNPTNPYSASKAAAEMIVNGYIQSFNFPACIVRANNMFGVRQFPEKLIPRSLIRLLAGQKVQLHGDGRNQRTYLSVRDFCRALEVIIHSGVNHEIFNIGTNQEYTNIAVAEMLCELVGLNREENLELVADRPFNDRRYLIDDSKLRLMGWSPHVLLKEELPSILEYYQSRFSYYKKILRSD